MPGPPFEHRLASAGETALPVIPGILGGPAPPPPPQGSRPPTAPGGMPFPPAPAAGSGDCVGAWWAPCWGCSASGTMFPHSNSG
eukprot:gene10109-biopygen21292